MRKFLVIFFIAGLTICQTKNADKIIEQVKSTFDKIHDYQVDVNIKLDVNFVKMPDQKAHVYFKQPDKVKFESKGFAMLPRQSLNFSPAQLLHGDYTAIYVKRDTLDDSNVDVVKVIPNSDSSDVVLSTLWIDRKEHVVRKIETAGKRSGTVYTVLKYGNDLPLPSSIKFSFDSPVSEMQRMALQKEGGTVKPDRNVSKMQGSVIITYSNYQINKGIPDSVFEEKKK